MEKIVVLSPDLIAGLYGHKDKNLEMFRHLFPKVKLTARGDELKIVGETSEIDSFEKHLKLFIIHYEKFEKLTERDIFNIMERGDDSFHFYENNGEKGEIILHGKEGKIIKALTPNQLKIVQSTAYNDMLFMIGPAGTGKTYTSVALAVRALKNRQIRKIILTRPAVEAGENLGFLPGDLRDKLDPYLQPLYDALWDMMPMSKLLGYMEDKTIEIAPLAFMRGRTLDNAYVILDEAQNATENQLKMFLTRMGKNAKFFITGDITQIDLPKNQNSGLLQASKILRGIKGIDFIY